MATAPCTYCAVSFYAKPSRIKSGQGKFCSRACSGKFNQKGREVICATCGAITYRRPRDLARSKSEKYFCTKRCQTTWRNQLYVGKSHKNFTNGQSSYRAVMLRSKPRICGLCRTGDSRVLAVHHIDKNRKNNKLKNLAWLCHNCHFLVHHYHPERERFMAAIV